MQKTKGWKNVLVLSSMRDDKRETNGGNLNVIVFYDHTKGGVDITDQMANVYTTRSKNRHCTMNALAYVLDTVQTNSYTRNFIQ